jgi:phage gp29-like protein
MASPTDYQQRAGFRRNDALTAMDPTPIRQASPSSDSAPMKGSDLGTMFSRSYDGATLGQAWLAQIAQNDDTILKREGIADLRLYDALLDDDTAKTAFDQRALAVVERPWTVDPGDPEDPRSVQAADDLRAMMNAVGWDRVTRRMLFGLWYGYAVAEAIFDIREHDGRSIIWLSDVVVPDRKWFAFTNAGELRMKSPGDAEGVAVPDNKFWSWRVGGTHDFQHYGIGLAHWCYWPIWFKRNGLQFWALFLEKFGQPTALVPFMPGADDEAIAKALEVGRAIGQDSAVAMPANQLPNSTSGDWLKPVLIEATRGGGADQYPAFKEAMNDAIRGIVLGQPGTSSRMSTGLGSGQSDVQEGVKDTQARADSDEFHESFNGTFPRWLTLWNYGPDVAPPTVYRNFDEAEDLDTIADRDTKLDQLGWQRTEQSFQETYGDGYERKPEPKPPVIVPGAIPGQAPAAANDNPPGDQREAVFAAGDPKPLYISRALTPASAKALLGWARGAGFVNLEDATELHVTQCYSRTPVDWFAMPTSNWLSSDDGTLTVRMGGPRAVEVFGGDSVVLMISSDALSYRAEDLKVAGASYDHDPYRPHVTFAKGPQTVDLSSVEPFTGELQFAPEIWEALDTDPVDLANMPAFSATELDQVDRLTAELSGDLNSDVSEFGAAIAARVAAFTASGAPITAQGLRLAMLQALDKPDAVNRIATRLALPFAAEHAAEAAGVADALGE